MIPDSLRNNWPRRVAAVFALGAVLSCGDGAVEPPPPPPDPPRATTVTVTPATAELTALGQTVRFTAEVRDQNGLAMAGAAVAWSSGDPSVATVDASGLVTAAGNGTATITASAGSASGAATVTVMQSPDSVAVLPVDATLAALGDTLRLAAEAFDANGRAVAAADFTWESGDTAIATVDASGLVTAAGNGTATITATSGETSGDVRVTVMQSAGSVVVTPAAETVWLRDTLRLAAEAFDSNGHAIADAEFEWFSSDASVATVDGSGVVRAVSEGTATITAASGEAEGTSEIIAVENPDRAALVALYNATDGPNWSDNENWLTDTPLGEWYGVGTDGGRVTLLDLPGNDLTGSIPPELGGLANLEWLVLRENSLTGPIPPGIGSLDSLEVLDLDNNALTGLIPPELGNIDLLRLRIIGLDNNALTGPIPLELGNLANGALRLANNALTGPIPPELGSVSALFVENNALTGQLPTSFVDSSIQQFEWGGNAGLCAPGTAAFRAWLAGTLRRDGRRIPYTEERWFCNSDGEREALVALYEATDGPNWVDNENWLTDAPLGEWYGVNTDGGHVTLLYLPGNGLTGSVPPELGNLVSLAVMKLADNNLTGPIPPELGNLTNLWQLLLDSNGLTGRLPRELGNLASMQVMALASNDLTGSIPPELGNLANLVSLNLSNNELTGSRSRRNSATSPTCVIWSSGTTN